CGQRPGVRERLWLSHRPAEMRALGRCEPALRRVGEVHSPGPVISVQFHNSKSRTRCKPRRTGSHPRPAESTTKPLRHARISAKAGTRPVPMGEARANSTTDPKIYRKLSTRQNVPPNPLTILL